MSLLLVGSIFVFPAMRRVCSSVTLQSALPCDEKLITLRRKVIKITQES